MTNYGKCQFYRVIDVIFDDMNTIHVEELTLKEYYLKKYGINIIKDPQPLLRA